MVEKTTGKKLNRNLAKTDYNENFSGNMNMTN
jgi:hypothetical protein